MTVEYLDLILENCEILHIPGHCIGEFDADEIVRSIRRIACNAIMPMDVCKHFSVEIHRDADVQLDDHYGNTTISVFDRLMMYKDITSIDIHFIDESFDPNEEPKREVLSLFLDWRGDSQENPNQMFKLSKLGHLYIVVDASTTFEEVFPDDFINDKDAVNFRFKMYDVGDANKAAAEEWQKAALNDMKNDGKSDTAIQSVEEAL